MIRKRDLRVEGGAGYREMKRGKNRETTIPVKKEERKREEKKNDARGFSRISAAKLYRVLEH